MGDLSRKIEAKPAAEARIRKKRRKRYFHFKRNLLWAGIILIVTFILGAFLGTSSILLDKYFGTEDETLQSSIPMDVTRKLRDLDIDKLLRERDRLKR